MKTDALIVFTRNPELGKVKTRLAKTIGVERALAVYMDLLQHTYSVTKNIACDKFVFYDTNLTKEDVWSDGFIKRSQVGQDLGIRMQNAFQEVFDLGYKNCLIVGSDLFDLKTSIIENAFMYIQNNDVVIGPAEDGGYYLLGLKKVIPALFQNKNWGTETVFESTISDLKKYKIHLLETLNDIDTIEDLEKSNYKFL